MSTRREPKQRPFASTKAGRAAIAAWAKLPAGEQRQALLELIETRQEELKRLAPNILFVTCGYGTYRARKPQKSSKPQTLSERKAAKRLVDDVMGITFVVKRKKADLHERHRIPTHLLTYWPVDGQRVLCAVPTDVESADELRPTAQAPTTVTRTGVNNYARGVVTALVQPPDESNAPLWALSCEHVFGMTEYVGAAEPTDNNVHVNEPPGPTFATVTRYWGKLVPDAGTSFDAALAKVSSRGLAETARPVICDRFATIDEIQRELVIHTLRPTGLQQIKAKQTKYYIRAHSFYVTYKGLGKIYHEEVFEMTADPPTQPGDSGSPVTGVGEFATMLMGMHIAGDGQRAYMVPAYQLMKMKNFLRLSNIYSGEFLEFA